MMPVTPFATQLRTTRLGFGCANLGGRIGQRGSQAILEAAFDAGIRYFDTAPSYGYGEAESVLGRFLQGRREGLTIATKFGIVPPKRSLGLRFKKSAARAAVAVLPQLRKRIRRRAERLTSTGAFSVSECKQSLRNSLRELRTEYIDVLLMHEILPEQITPELIDFLEQAKDQGIVRSYGTATTADSTISIKSRHVRSGEVAQFPSNVFENTLQMLPAEDTLKITITHSSLGDKFRILAENLKSDWGLRNEWSSKLGFDCACATQVGRLLLAAAMRHNSNGVVLFSSQNKVNIRENAALTQGPIFSEEQFAALKTLVSAFLEQSRPQRIGAISQ
jgi:D-threo-aldose 1-dehydrogenase